MMFYWLGSQLYVVDAINDFPVTSYKAVYDLLSEGYREISVQTASRLGWPS